MIVHRGYEGFHPVNPVVTVGVFDGVHRGHRALLKAVTSKAAAIGGESVVMTFSVHPRSILEKDQHGLMLLTTLSEKIGLLEHLDIDHLLIADFNAEFAGTAACDFVKNVIKAKIGARYLVFGYDHRIGREGEGDFNTIRQCSDLGNLVVEQASGVFSGEVAISSSAVRDALLLGNVDIANELLGYEYELSGKVITGRMIGRSFGFPTANIRTDPDKLVPAKGVYAVKAVVNYKEFPGMLSIGTNPTINPHSLKRSIEVHIIGFDEDIYGKKISLRFVKKLRDERKFQNTDALTRQMEKDKLDTLNLFG
jgi:riboflavin kinase/FMN adenylyltransferase